MRRLLPALAALALALFALVGTAAPAVAATPTGGHVATELRTAAPALTLPMAPNGPKGPGQKDTSTFEFSINGAKGKPSTPLTVILAMTVLSVAPALLLMCTCFTKILVVLGLTRNALGLTTVPPNQVLAGLALFLSLFVMGPVLSEMNEVGVQPYLKGDKGQSKAFSDGVAPLREFMIGKTRTDELRMITGVAGYEKPENPQSVPLATLIPAFVLSELKSAFIIGFIIFVPFLIIDLIVSAALMSMGMMMLPPVMISLPFKLLLFVMVDGWGLIITSLLKTYSGG